MIQPLKVPRSLHFKSYVWAMSEYRTNENTSGILSGNQVRWNFITLYNCYSYRNHEIKKHVTFMFTHLNRRRTSILLRFFFLNLCGYSGNKLVKFHGISSQVKPISLLTYPLYSMHKTRQIKCNHIKSNLYTTRGRRNLIESRSPSC